MSETDAVAHDPAPFWLSRIWWLRAGKASVGLWTGIALAFLASILVARHLGPADYGSVVFSLAVTGLLVTLFDLTLDEAVVYFGSRIASDAGAIRMMLRTALIIDVANAILVGAALLLLADILAAFVGATGVTESTLRAAALVALSSTTNGTTGGILLLAGKPDLRGWLVAAASFGRLTAAAIAVAVGLGIVGILLAFALAGVVTSTAQGVIVWRVTRRLWPQSRAQRTPAVKGWALLRFSLHTAAATSILTGRGKLVPIIVGGVAGPSALGLFTVSMFPVSVASVATGGIRMSLFPEQTRMASAGNNDELRRSIRGYTKLGLAFGLPSAAVGYFILPGVLRLVYSDEYAGSVTPARIMLIAAVVYLALGWTKTLPAALGRPGIRTVVSLVDTFVTVLLVAALISDGATGAAIGFSCGAVFVAATWVLVYRRYLSAPVSARGRHQPAR